MGFPIPEPYAVYHAWRHCGGIPVHRTKAALAHAVRTLGRSFVAKPVNGMWGRNVTAVRALIRPVTPSSWPMARLSARGAGRTDDQVNDMGGVLLQELLAPHPSIHERCGDRICSIRMVTVIDQRGPRLIATVWKVATGESMADNYWEPGNLIAPIDPESGVVGRTFTGLGRNIRHVDAHPDTGRLLPGFELPDWRQAVELCLSATGAIPRLPMQAWDIALTSRGPVLLEVNVNGGMRLPQLCAEAGLLRGEFAAFLSSLDFRVLWPRDASPLRRDTPMHMAQLTPRPPATRSSRPQASSGSSTASRSMTGAVSNGHCTARSWERWLQGFRSAVADLDGPFRVPNAQAIELADRTWTPRRRSWS